jgi:hypothetical protein
MLAIPKNTMVRSEGFDYCFSDFHELSMACLNRVVPTSLAQCGISFSVFVMNTIPLETSGGGFDMAAAVSLSVK